MARFVVGDDRSQSTLFPERLEDYANPRATDFNDLKDATWAWSHRMRGYSPTASARRWPSHKSLRVKIAACCRNKVWQVLLSPSSVAWNKG